MDIPLQTDPRQGERLLRLYHFFRITVGLALVLLTQTDLHKQLMDVVSPTLFQLLGWCYLVINIVISLLQQRADSSVHLFFTALLDITLLSLVFYEAGGVPSGLGSLLVISVAIANTLLHGKIGLVIAAMASISLIFLTFYLSLSKVAQPSHYVQAGGLGLLCFTAALFVQALSRRARQSEDIARRHAAKVEDLQTLNALILQRMPTGILVVDPEARILLANPASHGLLGAIPSYREPLGKNYPELQAALESWQRNPALVPHTLRGHNEGPVLQPGFAILQRQQENDLLIFLEDISQITQQAQQIKLASLGRLTASIAHEIRNPLGALSHAAQLLQEAEDLSPPDQRLTQIILDHSRRMNLIVENILQLSRRRQSDPEPLALSPWLQSFCETQQSGLPPGSEVRLECSTEALQTRFDPEQLAQVLINLLQNGLRYSARSNGEGRGRITLHLHCETERQQPVLDVIDDGPGIDAEQAHLLFEPFYTTENKGTGLGLYISRELCESNGALLDYLPREGGGACFRITFTPLPTAS